MLNIANFKKDIRSKIIDGLAIVLFLWLIAYVIRLMQIPFEKQFGNPGQLVYSIGLLAVAIIFLERSQVQRFSQMMRAWYGMASGVFAWAFTRISSEISQIDLSTYSSLLILIMIGLIIAVLWRKELSLGPQFFALVFIMNWVGVIFYTWLSILSGWNIIFRNLIYLSGFCAILLFLLGLGYLFIRTEWRIQRMWLAIWIWFLGTYIGYVFLNWFYLNS